MLENLVALSMPHSTIKLKIKRASHSKHSSIPAKHVAAILRERLDYTCHGLLNGAKFAKSLRAFIHLHIQPASAAHSVSGLTIVCRSAMEIDVTANSSHDVIISSTRSLTLGGCA